MAGPDAAWADDLLLTFYRAQAPSGTGKLLEYQPIARK